MFYVSKVHKLNPTLEKAHISTIIIKCTNYILFSIISLINEFIKTEIHTRCQIYYEYSVFNQHVFFM